MDNNGQKSPFLNIRNMSPTEKILWVNDII